MAQSLGSFGQIHFTLSCSAFSVVFALGDVLACDQDDQLIVQPPHGFWRFHEPKATELSLRTFQISPNCGSSADVFQAYGNAAVPGHMLLFGRKDFQHGLPEQFADGVAELYSAECVDGQHGAGRVDHEIHHRVVLEYLLPLRLAC